MRKNKLKVWTKGLIAAGLSGAGVGGSVVATACTISPQTFNLGSEYNVVLILKLFGIAAVISGISGVCTYLAKSPLPTDEEEEG